MYTAIMLKDTVTLFTVPDINKFMIYVLSFYHWQRRKHWFKWEAATYSTSFGLPSTNF